MWLLKWYRDYRDKKKKKAEEEYQERKKARDQTFIYILRFLDKETGKIYAANFPYNEPYEVEFDEKLSKMSLISIDLFAFSEPVHLENIILGII